MQQCFKKDKKVFFEYTPILESIYTSSGVDVEYSIDSTIVKLFFITQNSKMLQHKVDIKSILVKNKDSLRVWQIELPEKVNKIIVSPPDSVFVQNIKPFSKLNN